MLPVGSVRQRQKTRAPPGSATRQSFLAPKLWLPPDGCPLVLTPVTGQIALAIAFHVTSPNETSALDRAFPHSRVYDLSLPRNVARETNVYR